MATATPNGLAKLSPVLGDGETSPLSPLGATAAGSAGAATAIAKDSSAAAPSGSTKLAGAQFLCDMLVRRNADSEADFLDVRIAVVGNVDSGKSTLLGTCCLFF